MVMGTGTAPVMGGETPVVMGTQTTGPMGTSTAAVGPVGTSTPGVMVTGTSGTTSATLPGFDIASIPTQIKQAPEVKNADEAKQFKGKTITYYGDSVGTGHDFDTAAAKKFSQATGITVKVIPRPSAADAQFQTYARLFQAKSPNGDVLMMDVVWPVQFAPFLVDLMGPLADRAKIMYPGTIQGETINGKLVSMPWFTDFGLLYYRTDLLKKYGIDGPPATWDDLESAAKKIMDGEKGNLQGFVFQGDAYEGLTCNALEWIASTGGGTFIDSSGKVTINNPQAVQMLNKVKGWVGGIAPRGVTTYQEGESEGAFDGGNAIFLRNWPYVYSIASAKDSKVKGKFGVAPLPAAQGQDHVATIGGQALGISKFSKAQDAAAQFVKYLTSPEVEAWRALAGSYAPTIPALAQVPKIVQERPFLQVQSKRVARPTAALGKNYNQGSSAIYQGVHNVESGADAKGVLPGVAQQLKGLVQS